MDVIEQLHHQLPAFAEPLAKETVTVDLDEGDVSVFGEIANRQLLSECFAQRSLSCARRTVKKQNAIKRDYGGVDATL